MTAKIVFSDDTTIKCLSRFAIPYWLTQYLVDECVIYDDKAEDPIYVPEVEECQLCFREFGQATMPRPQLCQYTPINHEFDYVAKICVDCYYFIELKLGSRSVPRSVMKTLEAGHQIKKFDYLLD